MHYFRLQTKDSVELLVYPVSNPPWLIVERSLALQTRVNSTEGTATAAE